ncbi:DNA-processing protein DprA [Devriesea agamarum]|uniref:DNA-processing protein DprA n=1 Tax=Devriesea agamarum TaxID=472569 RepID=UPI00071C4578|nr:DNA-processing protein DprA [Devriesea agamarum]
MTNLSQAVQDERTARMVLSMVVEPYDAVTSRLLAKLGVLELFRLAESSESMPDLRTVDTQVWRSQFERSDARTLEQNVVKALCAGIGARASTSYSEHVAAELASDLVNADRVVLAGGTYGIEGAAHRATLASGADMIAVMANGVDRLCPMGHRELLERMADLGLLVSEVPPGAVATRHRFIARTRLMAALSAATAVVEAGVR